jgi:hypothetical protein
VFPLDDSCDLVRKGADAAQRYARALQALSRAYEHINDEGGQLTEDQYRDLWTVIPLCRMRRNLERDAAVLEELTQRISA